MLRSYKRSPPERNPSSTFSTGTTTICVSCGYSQTSFRTLHPLAHHVHSDNPHPYLRRHHPYRGRPHRDQRSADAHWHPRDITPRGHNPLRPLWSIPQLRRPSPHPPPISRLRASLRTRGLGLPRSFFEDLSFGWWSFFMYLTNADFCSLSSPGPVLGSWPACPQGPGTFLPVFFERGPR